MKTGKDIVSKYRLSANGDPAADDPRLRGHLCSRPSYRGPGGLWHHSYFDALDGGRPVYRWNTGAILSAISFHYAVGDMTLLEEIRRDPWLSRIDEGQEPYLLDIPPHGRRIEKTETIAGNLLEKLRDEAAGACRGRDDIYILLSGGLDSRIVASTVARLYDEGRIKNRPAAVTWGLENSRDYQYGRAVARTLGLEWIHIDIGPGTLIENIELSALNGNLLPPSDLHCLSWFRRLSPASLVLAGSYGDSIGRGEYSGQHLLELRYHNPSNLFGLVRAELCAPAARRVEKELTALRGRGAGRPVYAVCELEQQAHYMRGMIHQAISIVSSWCDVYQLFTDPSVYSYIWSIHPSLRGNAIYASLLELLDRRLARIPWARTNRAMSGKTVGRLGGLQKEFHNYSDWISGELYKRISEYVDPAWFASTGIFNGDKVERLGARLSPGRAGGEGGSFKPYSVYLWLAAFRRFAELCGERGKTLELSEERDKACPSALLDHPPDDRSFLRKVIGRSRKARELRRKFRRVRLKKRALKEFPPEPDDGRLHGETWNGATAPGKDLSPGIEKTKVPVSGSE